MKKNLNGRWEQKNSEDFRGECYWQCPECQFAYTPHLIGEQPFENDHNYCPRCGALLIEDDE